MKIGIDLDGVLYPWHEEVWMYFIQTTPGMPTDWNWFWGVHNRTKFFGYDPLDHAFEIDFLYVSGSPPGLRDQEIIRNTLDSHDVYYVTARPPTSKDATLYWLNRYDFIPNENKLIFDHNKSKVSEKLGLDYFIEDRVSNLEALLFTGTKPVGIKQVWNKHVLTVIPMFDTIGEALTYILTQESYERTDEKNTFAQVR